MSFRGNRGSGGRGNRGGGGNRGTGGGRGGHRGGCNLDDIYTGTNGVVPHPDPAVTQHEDALIKKSQELSAQMGGLGLGPDSSVQELPKRPGYNSKGTPSTMWANMVRVDLPQKLTFYTYSIKIVPAVPETQKRKRARVIALALETPELDRLRLDVLTDFRAHLISRQSMSPDPLTVTFPYRAEGEDEPRENPTVYTVSFLKAGIPLSAHSLIEYLNGVNLSAAAEPKRMVQALNVFFKYHGKTSDDFVDVGVSKIFPRGANRGRSGLTYGLEAIRGFFSSVRLATMRVLVNVQVTHGAFYEPVQLDKLIAKFDYRCRSPEWDAIESLLKGLRVHRLHLQKRKNKSGKLILSAKSIAGFAHPDDGDPRDEHFPIVAFHGAGPKKVKFWYANTESNGSAKKPGKGHSKKPSKEPPKGPPNETPSGTTAGAFITVYNYFRQNYPNFPIRPEDEEVPVMNLGSSVRPIYVPAQFCQVLPGQSFNQQLSPDDTARMIGFAVRRPKLNALSIVSEGLATSGLGASNSRLNQFGVRVASSLITVPARLLSAPTIRYQAQRTETPRFASWNLSQKAFFQGGSVKKWSCLQLTKGNYGSLSAVGEVMQRFHEELRRLGITAAAPSAPRRAGSDGESVAAALKTLAETDKLELLIVLVPDTGAESYNRIKKLCDQRYGMHSLCCVESKMMRGQSQYFANVGMKFNLKLGGLNHTLDLANDPAMKIISEGNTMLVGLDVTHPSPGSSFNAPSIAGMVASVDKYLGQFPGIVRRQSAPRQEMVSSIYEMMNSRLNLWAAKSGTNRFPQNIILYRDGVSDGQYDSVVDQEIRQIQAVCDKKYPKQQQDKGLPRLTVVVVGKRHKIRFYPTSTDGADNNANPKPGTVVDRGVTEGQSWDFYVQPHSALQGTARPAHYFVVRDDVFRNYHRTGCKVADYRNAAELLIDFTHKLCYGYGRATKAVSLAPPAYYADLICERARRYLSHVFVQSTADESTIELGDSMQPHANLQDTMYYI